MAKGSYGTPMTVIRVRERRPRPAINQDPEGSGNSCPICWAAPFKPCTTARASKKIPRPARRKAMHPERRLPLAERNRIAAAGG